MKKKSILLGSFVCLMLIFATVSSSGYWLNDQILEAENINCQIELSLTDYEAADRLILKYTISNTSDKSITILKWNTPIEGINANIFNILSDDIPVLYTGKLIKRGNPRPEDYVTIKPNEVISGEVNLEDAYYISKSGDYSIVLNTVIPDFGYDSPEQLSAKKAFNARSLKSNKRTFKLVEDKNLPEFETNSLGETASQKTPSCVNCSIIQQVALNTALSNAQSYSSVAYNDLINAPEDQRSTAERYIAWFGTYSASNWNTVSNYFNAINSALTNQTITFHCDCNENYYAYVYANQPYHIYICSSYWSAPDTGTDSKSGVVIHEASHFSVVASTQDYVYGQSLSKILASTFPSRAVSNADNYEYFAENNPELDMPSGSEIELGLNLTLLSLLFMGLIISAVFVINYRRLRTSK